MTLRPSRTLAAAIVVLVLAACGGSGRSPPSPGGGGASAAEPAQSVAGAAAGSWQGVLRDADVPPPPSPGSPKAVPQGGRLRALMWGDLEGGWDGSDYSPGGLIVDGLTCNTLVGYANTTDPARAFELRPELADALPTVSPDRRTYAFRLRPGIRYSDGRALVGEDVAGTFLRMFDPRGGFPVGDVAHFDAVEGLEQYRAGARRDIPGIRVEGSSVTFALTRPDGGFLHALAYGLACIVPRDAPHAPAALPPPTTAAYVVSSHHRDQSARLDRNPYWLANVAAGLPAEPDAFNVDRIDVTIGVEPAEQVRRIHAGRADLSLDGDCCTGSFGLPRLTLRANRDGLRTAPNLGVWFARFDLQAEPFDDPRVRQAANLAVDRTALVALVGGPRFATPTSGLLPRVLAPAAFDPYPAHGDLPRARTLLRQAGVRTPIDAGTIWYPIDGVAPALARHIAADLRKIGLVMRTRGVDKGVYASMTSRADWHGDALALGDWIADIPDGANTLAQLRDPGGAFDDPDFDRAFARADAIPPGPARRRAFARLSRDVAARQAPWLTLFTGTSANVVSDRVGRYAYLPAKYSALALAYVQPPGLRKTVPQGGRLRALMGGDPDDAWDGAQYTVIGQIVPPLTCNTLVGYPDIADPARWFVLRPELAAAMPAVSPDGRTYRFGLRSHIRFSDGRELTAEDVRQSFLRIFDPRAGFPVHDLTSLDAVEGLQAYRSGAADDIPGIDVDRHTVTFRLTRPDGALLHTLSTSLGCIYPRDAPHRRDAVPPPATGPYVLTEHTPDRSARLDRNPFWPANVEAGLPSAPNVFNVDGFDIQMGVSPAEQVRRIEDGRADLSFDESCCMAPLGGPRAAAPAIPGDVRTAPSLSFWFAAFDVHAKPFDDPRVRRAANLALDRSGLVAVLGGPRFATAASGILPPLLAPRAFDPFPPRGDRPRARALLRQAGVRVPVRVGTLWYPAGEPLAAVARKVVADLREVGLVMRARGADPRRYFSLINRPGWHGDALAIQGWFAEADGASTFAQLLTSATAADGSNAGDFRDQAFDAELARIEAIRPGGGRRRALAGLSHDLAAVQSPWLTLVAGSSIDVVSRRIGGYTYNPVKGSALALAYLKH